MHNVREMELETIYFESQLYILSGYGLASFIVQSNSLFDTFRGCLNCGTFSYLRVFKITNCAIKINDNT